MLHTQIKQLHWSVIWFLNLVFSKDIDKLIAKEIIYNLPLRRHTGIQMEIIERTCKSNPKRFYKVLKRMGNIGMIKEERVTDVSSIGRHKKFKAFVFSGGVLKNLDKFYLIWTKACKGADMSGSREEENLFGDGSEKAS